MMFDTSKSLLTFIQFELGWREMPVGTRSRQARFFEFSQLDRNTENVFKFLGNWLRNEIMSSAFLSGVEIESD